MGGAAHMRVIIIVSLAGMRAATLVVERAARSDPALLPHSVRTRVLKWGRFRSSTPR